MQPSRIVNFREKQDGGTRNSQNLNINNGRIVYKYERSDRASERIKSLEYTT